MAEWHLYSLNKTIAHYKEISMETLPIIIVEDSYGLSAVFPTLAASTYDTMTVLDAVSGHGPGTKEWYKTTRIAKDSSEKTAFLNYIKNIYNDVELQEYKRWIPSFDKKRLENAR